MPTDLRVTVDDKTYDLDIEQALEDLTGEETLEVEDLLGGWENFDATGDSAKSVYILYWLARRSSDANYSLKDALKEKGVLFGDRVEMEEVDDPPAEAASQAAIPSTPSEASVPSGVGT